jgi:hypothetical protein
MTEINMDKKTEINMDKKTEISDAINGFYNLKGKYERDFQNKYLKDIIKNKGGLSKREKRVAYSKLPKPKCVNCKRNVGTIFNIIYDATTDMKKFIAKCGDISDPCPLDINFEMGTVETYNNMILEQETLINDYKKTIITAKNDLLFGYLHENEASSIFETTANKLKDATNTLGFFVEKNILVNSNPAKREVLKTMIVKFGEMEIDYKKMMYDFDKKDDIQILNRAVNFYVDEMVPMIKNIQETKYDVNIVEYNEDSSTFHLIQLPNSLDNSQVSFDVDDTVHSYVTGLTRKTTGMTRKNRDSKKDKTKTKKIKPVLDFVIEDDVDEDDVDGNEEKEVIGVQEYSNDAMIDEDGEISWENPKYQRVWNSLSQRYRNNLSQYPEWAKLTIEKFISDVKSAKYREYINPPDLIIPPQKMDDGSLDFGNEVYNELYKTTNDWERSILNTMRPGVNGGSESAYKNYLETLFKDKVGFSKY